MSNTCTVLNAQATISSPTKIGVSTFGSAECRGAVVLGSFAAKWSPAATVERSIVASRSLMAFIELTKWTGR